MGFSPAEEEGCDWWCIIRSWISLFKGWDPVEEVVFVDCEKFIPFECVDVGESEFAWD